MKDLVGKLLIAPPIIKGSPFQETVILLTEDLGQRQIGIVLNKPSQVTFAEFSKQNGVDLDLPGYIYLGGPANPRAFTMVHSNDWTCNNTMKVDKNVSISSSPEILDRLAAGDMPRYWRAFIGMCSWENGKLHKELTGMHPYLHSHSWLIATPSLSAIFNKDHSQQWTNAIEIAGTEFIRTLFT